MSCGTSFQCQLKQCPSNVLAKIHLLAATNYLVVLTDKFGKKFKQTVISNANGSLPIDFDLFDTPDGSFTSYSGTFTLEVFDTAGREVTFTMCGTVYTSISVSFYQGEGVTDAVVTSTCNIPVVGNTDPNFFYKEFTPGLVTYDIAQLEHLLTQINSIELWEKVAGVWQVQTMFTYTLDNPLPVDLQLQALNVGNIHRVYLTGLS
jgi:hypothetical protein